MTRIVHVLRKEFLELLPPTVFFFICFGLLIFTKRLLLKQYGISFSDFGAAVIGALVIGKVVLIADHLRVINKFPDKPLIYNVVWKALIYLLVALVIRVAEFLVPMAIKYGSVQAAIARAGTEVSWPHFWIIYIWLSVLLLLYCTAREFIRAIGRERVLTMFFGPGRA